MAYRPPAELPHWWGGRRGRTGGGGAVLWGATDRDGMGGPGEGTQGSQRPSSSPRSAHTRTSHSHTPPLQPGYNTSLFFIFFYLFLSALTPSLTPRVDFLLWWTDLCMPLLDSAHQSDQIRPSTCWSAWLEWGEMVQLKTTKWNPGPNQTTEPPLAQRCHNHIFQTCHVCKCSGARLTDKSITVD